MTFPLAGPAATILGLDTDKDGHYLPDIDVDGDGIPEIGVAGQSFYTVFNRDGSVRWSSAISDRTSNSTGAIAFDLDGDGQVEIIYRDEYYDAESDQQGLAEVHLAKHRNGPTGTAKLSFLKRFAKFADLANV